MALGENGFMSFEIDEKPTHVLSNLSPQNRTSTEASESARSRAFDGSQKKDDTMGSQIEATESNSERPQTLAREMLFLLVLFSSQILTQAGLALSIVTQHIIARSFAIENQPGELSWFSAAYSLTVGTFILIAGRLGDVFGHKRFVVGGFIWFGIWSTLAGFAVYSGSAFFIFCRAMQGIGPAFLLPNAIAIIARCYEPGPRQNMIFGLFGATAPSGFLLGAVFGSLLSQLLWWPWSYWIMACACLLMALLSIFVLPATSASHIAEHHESSIWQRIDVFGSISGVAALVLFNFAWNQGPVVGWSTPYTYILMICGILIFVAFVAIEKRVRHPLIPFGVLKVDSLFTLACISAGWSSFGILVFYGLNFLEVLRGLTPLHTSAQFVPVALSGICASVTTGLSLSRLRASTVMLIALLAFLVGGILLATMPVQQTYWAKTFVAIVILPWGMDMSFPAATIILSRAMPRQHQGLAASLVNTFVNYSISIGLGIAGTVESQVNGNGKEILQGYRGAFYLGVGLSGLGVVLASVFCFVELQRATQSKEVAQESGETGEESSQTCTHNVLFLRDNSDLHCAIP